ncbi:hypothetical protein ACFY3V_33125 [Streptosporangium sp. NPDC000095]|uniref:hypothetical protein n=1 Tax=Streptosporangium sp. NPDC000095 TaxID=3366184 RepID=UPI0036901770
MAAFTACSLAAIAAAAVSWAMAACRSVSAARQKAAGQLAVERARTEQADAKAPQVREELAAQMEATRTELATARARADAVREALTHGRTRRAAAEAALRVVPQWASCSSRTVLCPERPARKGVRGGA